MLATQLIVLINHYFGSLLIVLTNQFVIQESIMYALIDDAPTVFRSPGRHAKAEDL
jgi:hypothetical protein